MGGADGEPSRTELLPGAHPRFDCSNDMQLRKWLIQEQVQDMLKQRVISSSGSPWCSPMVLAKKRGGKI